MLIYHGTLFDLLGNGIGISILGGQPMPRYVYIYGFEQLDSDNKLLIISNYSPYDSVNKCIVTSGAFVEEVFQNSNVYLMREMQRGKCVDISCLIIISI